MSLPDQIRARLSNWADLATLRSRLAPGPPSSLLPSLKVAGVATLVAAALYVILSAGIVVLVVRAETAEVDNELLAAVYNPDPRGLETLPHLSPIREWVVSDTGVSVPYTDSTPSLPTNLLDSLPDRPTNVRLADGQYRLVSATVRNRRPGLGPSDYYLVVGENIDFISQTVRSQLISEAVAGVPILLVVFLAAFTIGRRSAAPLERAHQRLLAFTADASHELRTPLSVIEAEVSLALLKKRSAESYREAIERIGTESGRIRHLIDDLLWLARFDAQPGPPAAKEMELGAAAANAVERFEAVARSRGQTLELLRTDATAVLVAPEEWIDRLLGVLLDNACHYTPEGGSIRVRTAVADHRIELAVEDSGPGVPEGERERIFERFHRGTTAAGGAGLGLAIGSAIVQATGGRWELGASELGGARFVVRWGQPRRPSERSQAVPTTSPSATRISPHEMPAFSNPELQTPPRDPGMFRRDPD